MAFTTVVVTATYLNEDGTPARGSVTFQRSAALQDSTNNQIAAAALLTARLNSSGHISVGVIANDDATSQPTGTTYTVKEHIVGSRTRTYRITVEHTAGTVDLADLAPAVQGPQTFTYALQSALTTEAATRETADNALQDAIDALGGGGGGGASLSDANPVVNGPVSPGVGTLASRDDHVHPHDTAAGVGADVAGAAATVQTNLNTHAALTTGAHGGIVADSDARLVSSVTGTNPVSALFASNILSLSLTYGVVPLAGSTVIPDADNVHYGMYTNHGDSTLQFPDTVFAGMFMYVATTSTDTLFLDFTTSNIALDDAIPGAPIPMHAGEFYLLFGDGNYATWRTVYHGGLSNDGPLADGSGDAGTSPLGSRADHVHPAGSSPTPGGIGALAVANDLSDLNDAPTARGHLGLGTLATQNGTFSGTSSGTNTGDQTISDATISTSDITTNNASTSKHGFLKKLDNNAAHYMDGTGAWSTPTATDANQSANLVKAGPASGAAAAPTYRALVRADLPASAQIGDGKPKVSSAPVTANAKDDEFADLSGQSGPVNGLDVRWSKHNLGTSTWLKLDDTVAPGALLFDIPTGQSTDQAIYQAVPVGDFTLYARAQMAYTSDRQMWGVFIVNTSGTGVAVNLDTGQFNGGDTGMVNVIRNMTTWQQAAGTTTLLPNVSMYTGAGMPVLISLRKASGLFYATVSLGDMVMPASLLEVTLTISAFTAAYIGFGRIFGTGQSKVALDFIRVV